MGFSILDFFSGGSWGPCSGGSGENGFSRIAPGYFTIKRAELNTHTHDAVVYPKHLFAGLTFTLRTAGTICGAQGAEVPGRVCAVPGGP